MESSVQKYRALLETVRLGSFTRAAEALNYTQSGVSRMIADIERDWEIKLLERNRWGVRLTTDGEELLPYVRSTCQRDDELREKISELKGLDAGRLSIGVISSVATHWLPSAILKFREMYPNIEYDLQIGSHSDIAQWVQEGRVDCGILRNPGNLHTEILHIEDDEFMAVMPPGHPMEDVEEFPISKLEEFPILTFRRNNDEEIEDLFRKFDIHVHPRVTTLDENTIMALVEHGVGISVLSRLMLTDHRHDIVVRPFDVHPSRELIMAVRDSARTSLVNKRFIDFIMQDWHMYRTQKAEAV